MIATKAILYINSIGYRGAAVSRGISGVSYVL